MTELNTGGSCCAPTHSISDEELISAIEFETDTRPHISLKVFDLRKSLSFYMLLFNEKPIKLKDDYAKFELRQPPLNITLNVHKDNYDQKTEYGLQIESKGDLDEIKLRFTKANYTLKEVGESVIINDPAGNVWEIYI